MSLNSGFSNRNQGILYENLCISLIKSLSERVLKALKNESCDDIEFSKAITQIHKKIREIELQKFNTLKFSDCFSDLANYCVKNYQLRSSSNETEHMRRYSPDMGSKTPILSSLEKILEESPRNAKSVRKNNFKKKLSPKLETSNHPYYESMIGKYLKMSFKSPLASNATSARNKQQINNVRLNDGMFFRLF